MVVQLATEIHFPTGNNLQARGSDDDGSSTAGTDITELTETTETTLVETNYELQVWTEFITVEFFPYFVLYSIWQN